MRKAFCTLTLLSSAFTLPLTAHADTIADFTLVGQGHTITWSLPDTAILMDHPHGITLSASASTTIDGVPGYNEFGTYYVGPGLSNLPTIVLSVPSTIDGGDLVLYGPWPLQVSEVIPMGFGQPNDLLVAFVPGTYDLTLNDVSLPLASYTLTVTTESAAAPEPSTFMLMATGVLGAITTLKSRKLIT
jgi:hypothetical protein